MNHKALTLAIIIAALGAVGITTGVMSSAIPVAVPMPNQAFAQVVVCGPGVPGPNGVIGVPCPPQTRITSAADANGNAVQNGGSTVSTSITFQVTGTPGTYPGYPIAGFLCSLDGSSFSSCSTNNPATISYNNLAVGQHTFETIAVDTQGNTDPFLATFSWTITMQPPTHTTITSATDGNGAAVQSGGSTVSTSITFQVTATPGTNPIAGFQCTLDGSSFSSCSTNNPATISYNNLAVGQHTFAVRAVDTQGNVDPTPASFTWTILTPSSPQSTANQQAGLNVHTNTQQKQECNTAGETSPISGSCHATSTNTITQSGGIHLRGAPSTLSLF
jgi:hypothetical protein